MTRRTVFWVTWRLVSRWLGRGVAESVGEGLLANAEQLVGDGRGDPGGVALEAEARGGLTGGVGAGDDGGEGVAEVLPIKGGGTETLDGEAGFAQADAGQVERAGAVVGSGGGVAGRLLQGLEVDDDAGKALGDGVVNVAGEAHAFVEGGTGLALAVEQGVFEGDADLGRDGEEEVGEFGAIVFGGADQEGALSIGHGQRQGMDPVAGRRGTAKEGAVGFGLPSWNGGGPVGWRRVGEAELLRLRWIRDGPRRPGCGGGRGVRRR